MDEETLLKLILMIDRVQAQLEMALEDATKTLKYLRELWQKEYGPSGIRKDGGKE